MPMVDGKERGVSAGPLKDRLSDRPLKYRDGVRSKKSKPRKRDAEKKTPSTSQTKISANPDLKSNYNRRDDIDSSPRQNVRQSQERVRDGQGVVMERRIPPESNSKTFHVRISIGYMEGLKIERINKRTKQPTNNRITVGFVELASSGKYSALSHPLMTTFEEKVNTTKVFWVNKRDGNAMSKSKSRRRLHFSLELKREDARDDNDDDLIGSHAPFEPELVKLLVGLKCGDERIPLGIAKFYVNGNDTSEHIMNLDVLPVTSPANGSKSKRGLFGKKQRNTFTDGDFTYTLEPSATLRLKADIKTGYPGQEGAQVWRNDDSSYTTRWTCDERPAPYTSSPGCGLNFPTVKTSPVKVGDQKVRSKVLCKEKARISERNETSMRMGTRTSHKVRQHRVPVPYVSVDSSNELVSVLSGISDSGCNGSWSCLSICCGEEMSMSTTRYGRLFTGSFSFESSHMNEKEIDNLNDRIRKFDMNQENRGNYARKKFSGNTKRQNKYRMT
mmetsp:Transcript_12498/g.35504  ORF Transcript_12498/g.35504 Transcript_12498/m.35504 type:complete len:501 (+) Transcript_12498:190-1692(+)|eukprot:CAMPEP_0172374516 /NCGR_PEP_ID=MMETSP1060-20121228/56068_1 /TAXON_ID=37318 /ORGANISM="Pseudo-nitzschia pungens, Strain cf. cingulata" /LENGTH=500 /DNA_ID=CAMNT_0013101217 /DNA_START=178 /DNA_END=1680 /DNA_ORIENTATION=-